MIVVLAPGHFCLNDDRYQQGWLVKVNLSDPSEAATLVNAEEYEATQ
jgi:glycine cleavage system H lipoate-binding protein